MANANVKSFITINTKTGSLSYYGDFCENINENNCMSYCQQCLDNTTCKLCEDGKYLSLD